MNVPQAVLQRIEQGTTKVRQAWDHESPLADGWRRVKDDEVLRIGDMYFSRTSNGWRRTKEAGSLQKLQNGPYFRKEMVSR